LPIGQEYKILYDSIRKAFNQFLDETSNVPLIGRPTRRQIFETIIYGMYAHRNSKKINKISSWKKDALDWDMIFFEFQVILHEFALTIKYIKKLNEKLLRDCGVSL
jgi:hypothetical protein